MNLFQRNFAAFFVGLAVHLLSCRVYAQDLLRGSTDEESGTPTQDRVVVVGRASDILGVATSSSEGVVSAEDLSTRPIFRPGEIMETIPGVIVTQHSGSGKANQHFLRGFNLDHGTDLATDFERMPINMPTHAHGQGYTDLNFLIPELVSEVDYKKGTYYAEVGDFGSAGGVQHSLLRRVALVVRQTGSRRRRLRARRVRHVAQGRSRPSALCL